MKKLGITQRVEIISGYNERRDCLDQNWYALAQHCGFSPIPLPNLKLDENSIHQYLSSLSLDAVVLSGGNSLGSVNNSAADYAPERDSFESAVVNYCITSNTPLLGVCRGMQMLNYVLGGKLTPVIDHAGTQHTLIVDPDYGKLIAASVNSYHNWGIKPEGLASNLKAIAHDDKGNIEAFHHQQYRITGIMWHPEREGSIRTEDAQLIDRFLI